MLTNLPLGVELGLITAIVLSAIVGYIGKKFSFLKIFIIFIVSILLFLDIVSLVKNSYRLFFYPTYSTSIVHVDTFEKTDDKGNGYLMYQPTYSFSDGDEEIRVKSAMSTSGELEIGSEVKIAYKDGEFVEYTVGTFILIIALLMGLAITSFILLVVVGMAIIKDFDIGKYAWSLIKIISFLFLFILFVGIVRHFFFLFLGEVQVSNMGMFALGGMFLLVLLAFNAIWSLDSNHIEKVEDIKEQKRKKKKKKKKSMKTKLEELNQFDSNIVAVVGIFFFTSIFSIIALVGYSDDGFDILVVVFGLIGIAGLILSAYYSLSYLYFKSLSFKMFTPIRNNITLKGEFLLKQNIMKSTIFMLTLRNTHKVSSINSEGEEYDKIETLWEIEKQGFIERNGGGFKIPFSFPVKNYKHGDLDLKIEAKLKWFTLERSYTLKEE